MRGRSLMSDVLRSRYVIGLGANLGDRLGTLRSAVLALGAHGRVERLSHVYETPALGPPQPDYLNAAALFETSLPPEALLAELLRIEQRHGRERRERWGPRTLDLDLLVSPGLVLKEPGLCLPHPELGRRPFALVPLLDVLPDARDELSGASYADLLAGLAPTTLRRVASSESWDPRSPR
jgi:2-amino-4-hydroxy-6-hydroxymethyldihydropteridine diphosphokinase